MAKSKATGAVPKVAKRPRVRLVQKHRPRLVFSNFTEVTFPRRSVHHLCRRAGVQRVHHTLYKDIVEIMKDFILSVTRDAAVRTFHARRRMIRAEEVQLALDKLGVSAYGYTKTHPVVTAAAKTSIAEHRERVKHVKPKTSAYEPYW